jgi:16S rRNA C967 or C1407 C5-methylase (RsmB/RsmF family)
VYSTCSLEPEENWEVVRAFLRSEAGAGFQLDPVQAQALGADPSATASCLRDGDAPASRALGDGPGRCSSGAQMPSDAERQGAEGVPETIITKEGCLHALPHVHYGVDGAFAARLVRVR